MGWRIYDEDAEYFIDFPVGVAQKMGFAQFFVSIDCCQQVWTALYVCCVGVRRETDGRAIFSIFKLFINPGEVNSSGSLLCCNKLRGDN